MPNDITQRYREHVSLTRNETAAAVLTLAEQVAVLVRLMNNVDQTVAAVEQEQQAKAVAAVEPTTQVFETPPLPTINVSVPIPSEAVQYVRKLYVEK